MHQPKAIAWPVLTQSWYNRAAEQTWRLICFVLGEAQKAEKAIFEKNGLQVQLRETQHTLEQKHNEITQLHNRYSSSYTELAQMKMQIETLHDQVHKVNMV